MICGIFGRTGTGKSTLFKAMVRASQRCVVIDPKSEHHDIGACVQSFEEFKTHWNANYRASRWHLVFQPATLKDRWSNEPKEALRPYLKAVAWKGKRYLVAIDEVDRFMTIHRTDKDISTVINLGRAWGVHLVAVARRGQAVHNELISQCSDLYLFGMTKDNDVDYFAEFIGDENCDRIRRLRTHECLHWCVDGSVEIVTTRPE
jgi:hypothetical protein